MRLYFPSDRSRDTVQKNSVEKKKNQTTTTIWRGFGFYWSALKVLSKDSERDGGHSQFNGSLYGDNEKKYIFPIQLKRCPCLRNDTIALLNKQV